MAVSFENIPSQVRTPLFYAEMNNEKAGFFTTKGRALMFGYMADSGTTATPLLPTLCATVGQANSLFGLDSMMAKMVKKFRDNDLSTELWCIALPYATPETVPTATDVDDALLNMGDMEFDFIGFPWADVTMLDKFKVLMSDEAGRWSPFKQLYGHVYSVLRGTLSVLQAFGTLRNDQHATIYGLEADVVVSDYEYLAARLARESTYVNADPARPTQTGSLVGCLGAPLSKRFVFTETETLLSNGIGTHMTGDDGSLRIQRSITTYQKNKWGENDPSYLDSETMHTSAYVIRRLKYVVTQEWPRHKLAADGTNYGAGQAIVTPSVIRTRLRQEYQDMETLGILENADIAIDNTIIEIDENDPNRINVLFTPDYVNQLRVFALVNQFRLNY